MTYADDVTSARSGDAIELYRFDGPQISYTHTSGTRAHTFTLDSLVYAPLAGLRRSGVGASSSGDKRTLTVTMSGACALATDYVYGTPPRSLRLRVYQLQRKSVEAVLIWDGSVTAAAAKGTEIELRSSSQLSERLGTPVPAVSFQRLCNHFLYDARCRISRATSGNHHEPVISSVNGSTITVSTIGAYIDQWFKSGEIVRDTDGERRTIVDQVGAVLKVNAPFRTLNAADAVTMYAGCAHTIAVCSDRFNNIANFGGHPAMEAINPFLGNVRLMKP